MTDGGPGSVEEPADAQHPGRLRDLGSALARLEERIVAACRAAGRNRDSVTLVAVTKTYPSSDVAALVSLGVRDIGENRVQELADKRRELVAVDGLPGLRWHFVGRLQSRQAPAAAESADVVHSVDRDSVIRRLGSAAGGRGVSIDALVQVSFDGDPARGGAAPSMVGGLADRIAATPGMRLAGVMGMPPLGSDPGEAYRSLVEISHRLLRDHPDARIVSAGMSGDLEAAVAAGATHLRVGTALLGHRGPQVR